MHPISFSYDDEGCLRAIARCPVEREGIEGPKLDLRHQSILRRDALHVRFGSKADIGFDPFFGSTQSSMGRLRLGC